MTDIHNTLFCLHCTQCTDVSSCNFDSAEDTIGKSMATRTFAIATSYVAIANKLYAAATQDWYSSY
jgi:hypothetical protein